MHEDLQHLRLLSIFHYVVAGLTAIASLVPLLHLSIGIAMVTGVLEGGQGDPPASVGWFFILLSSTWILAGLTLAVCIAWSGRCLTRHAQYVFCMAVAVASCFVMPFGTVLGVFTIIILMRPSVRALFGRGEATPAGAPPAA